MYPDPSTVLPQGADPTNASAKNPASIFGLSNLPTTLNAQQVQDFQKMTIPSQAPTDLTAQIMGFNQPIQQLESTQKEQETGQSQTQNAILNLMNQLSGQSQFQAQAEEQAGLPTLNKGLLDLQNLQRQQTLSYLQGLQNIEGKPIAMEFITGQQEQLNRQRAIDAMATSAQLQAMQGNITLAQDTVKRMVDAKYDPIIRNIETAKFILEQQGSNLSRTDKKLLEAKTSQAEAIKAKKEEEGAIQNMGIKLGSFGVDNAIIQDVLNSSNMNEAIMKAGARLQDPRMKMELENIRLEQILKRAEIEKKQKETRLLGEMTPAEKKAEREALKKAEEAIPILQDKVNLIDTLKTSGGLRGSVGTYGISRWTPFSVDKAERMAFIAGVNQLVQKETIDTLVNLKERGGTLGALSNEERQMLQESASKIGSWQLVDEDTKKVYGYEISEAEFQKELDNIKELATKALVKARGSLFSQEEQAILQSLPSANFTPNAYFK